MKNVLAYTAQIMCKVRVFAEEFINFNVYFINVAQMRINFNNKFINLAAEVHKV